MSKIFFTSDLHFGHGNIIKYCLRPFQSISEMNEKIISRWNSKVSPEDEVYILGDVAFVPTQEAVKLIKRLNGKKYLVAGNHDHKKIRDKEFSGCFAWIKDYAEIRIGEVFFVLFHYPISDWNGKNHGSIHLYGHVHNSQDYHDYLRGRMAGDGSFNVGMDVNDFYPVEVREIIKKNNLNNS